MQVFLENEQLKVRINTFGGELASIIKKETNVEYMWNADEKYWKRTSPVLFPIVGSLKNKEFLYEGKSYPMGQHGFARDMEFAIKSQSDSEAWFVLESDEETLKKYPFAFQLELGYRLAENKLYILWHVYNQDRKEMYFSIGGHPAFMCPLDGKGKQTDYFISFDTDKDLKYSVLNEEGLVAIEDEVLDTHNGMMPVDEHLFDRDALIIEGHQAGTVSLCDSNKKPYLAVTFDSPLFGLWSPAGKNAPFICIEPWYGRCDKASFDGTLKDREYGNTLQPDQVFEAEYTVEIF
ncbi:MAG: aldose 1-epimerase family protein [Lachnospiraceae bacterium]|nr:aldose 1-epimerase family protein [Lachnospiraceae bacterium]